MLLDFDYLLKIWNHSNINSMITNAEPEEEMDVSNININNRLLQLLKDQFTEEEEKWFIDQFKLYLMYGKNSSKFVINLDDVCKWLDIKKENAKNSLLSNFTINKDYIDKIPEEKDIPVNKNISKTKKFEPFYLNIDTFKGLCLLSTKPKAKRIRCYYIKMENVYNQYFEELLIEKDKVIQDNTKEIQELKRLQTVKTYEEVNTPESLYVLSDTEDGVYKIGFSNNTNQRIKSIQTGSSSSVTVLYEFKTYNMKLLEKIVHDVLHKYRVRNEFYKCNLEYIIHIIHIAGTTINTLKSTFETVNYEDIIERLKLKPVYTNIKPQIEDVKEELYSVEEQELYITKFKAYLPYENDKFPFNLDEVCRWLESKRKDKYKKMIIKHFTLNKDYIDDYPDINDINIKIKTSKSNNYKPCFLNAETFKCLCVLIGTDRSKFIRDCYTYSNK